MRQIIAVAASLAVNIAFLGALEWSALQAQTPPQGEVWITQLPDDDALVTLASVEVAQRSRAVL